MATTEEVKKLAALARIKIDDSQLVKFTSEFDAILAYVGQLEKLDLSGEKETKPALRNVMRKDGEPNPPEMYTKKIVEQFPASENNALSVKQIISHEEI
jgi:aspartyl-tRNA(Asn)/glutamyl-tRNA(Gln) amidotransferase subunit C